MILLDTNVLIYASTVQSPFLEWARRTIAPLPTHLLSSASPHAWTSRSAQ